MPNQDLDLLETVGSQRFSTILADPPWRFMNRTGKVAPEHRRLSRYGTMTVQAISALPVAEIAAEPSHLYLWLPNALLRSSCSHEGLARDGRGGEIRRLPTSPPGTPMPTTPPRRASTCGPTTAMPGHEDGARTGRALTRARDQVLRDD